MEEVRLQGVISTVVTPFDNDDHIAEEMLQNEVGYLLGADVHGICACGSTGEGHTLSLEESKRICEIVVDEVSGRVPVVGGIIQNSTARVIEYGRALKAAGVDALQVTPVHYLFSPSPEGTVDYYRTIGEELDMPIVVYNVVPWAMIPVDVVERLADLPHVVAIKQSGGDIHLLADLLVRLKDKLSILAAIDDLHFPAFAMGAHGTLAAIPTVTPHLTVQLWEAVRTEDYEAARRIHEKILPVWRTIDGPNSPSRLKEALNMQGRPVGKARHPMQQVSVAERSAIRNALEGAGLALLRERPSQAAL